MSRKISAYFIFLTLQYLLSACTGLPQGVQGHDTENAAVDITRRTDETDERRRARVRLELAMGYYREHSHSIALDELRKAIRIDPNFADAYGVLALVYGDLGERALAEESYQHALRLSPEDSYINTNYGWFLCQTGREAQSIAYFKTALRNPLYPTPALPLQNAGVCSLRLGDLKNAETYLMRSFELDPSSPVTMYNLATLWVKKGDYERAKFYAQRLVRRAEQPSAEILWLELRIERKLGGRLAEAALVTQLHRRFPDSNEYKKYLRGEFDE